MSPKKKGVMGKSDGATWAAQGLSRLKAKSGKRRAQRVLWRAWSKLIGIFLRWGLKKAQTNTQTNVHNFLSTLKKEKIKVWSGTHPGTMTAGKDRNHGGWKKKSVTRKGPILTSGTSTSISQ